MAKFEGQERRMPGINACLKKNTGTYGRFADAPKYIDPREE